MTQGTASNVNGRGFEAAMRGVLDAAGLTYVGQTQMYHTADGYGQKHDFVVTTARGPVVVECKHWGEAEGTLGEKVFYTVALMRRLPCLSIIVLGGPGWARSRPAVRQVRWLREETAGSTTSVMTEDEFEEWAYVQNRRQPENRPAPQGQLPYAPPLDRSATAAH